ncbi:MAG: hypothetical protein Q4B70_18110 [Lachnospiraceae bacterium]|nr:hypothetical protein [Lachnospiraceae bacterium]
MVLSPKVTMTDSIKKREIEVRKAIEKREECPFLYCVTLPSNEKNLLDIHPYRELRKRKEYENPYVIIGLARNRKEAFQIVTDFAAKAAAEMKCPEEFKEIFLKYRDSFLEAEDETGKE